MAREEPHRGVYFFITQGGGGVRGGFYLKRLRDTKQPIHPFFI